MSGRKVPGKALAGCNGVPISTQWKLRNFNPGTADIEQLRVAVKPPSWASPTPEKTILTARQDFSDGGPGKSLDIHLRRAAHAKDRAALAQLMAEPEALAIYEAAPDDLGVIRAFQADTKRKGGWAPRTGTYRGQWKPRLPPV